MARTSFGNSRRKGLFITIEGTEGSGKSTLIQGLERRFQEKGIEVMRTREPGGTLLAEKIRDLLLNESMNPWTELFLYEASRAEHLAGLIRPALEARKVVLCDRFTASTLAYQSIARNLPWKIVEQLNQIAIQKTKPDLNLFLDLDPAVGLARAQDPNRFEKEDLSFHLKVRKGFYKVIRSSPKTWVKIKVDKMNAEAVLSFAWKAIEKKL